MKYITLTKKVIIPAMLLITVILLTFSINCVSAATITVGTGGTYNSTTINGGINLASPGDTVVVYSGTYTGNVLLNKDGINLTSSGTGTVTIRPQNTANPVITVSGTNTIINGFTITGATTSNGILVNNNVNCDITDNTITSNGRDGIYITGGTSHVNIIDNELYSNGGTGTSSSYSGILINGGTNTIANNKIHDGGDDCIRIPGGTNIIIGNDLYNGEDGIDVEGGNNIIVANNIHNNRQDGVHIDGMGTGLVINFNRIIGNTQRGIHMYTAGTVNAENNWWGHNTAPTTGTGNGVDYYNNGGTVDANPWLVLRISAAPSPIHVGNTSTVTADLSYNSNGVIPASTTGYRLPITPVSFTTTDSPALGTLNPTNDDTNSPTDPTADSTFTAVSKGLAHITVTVDNQSLSTTVQIDPSTVLSVKNELYSQLEGQSSQKYGSEDYHYIHVKNNGPDTAKNVSLTDIISTASAWNIIEWWVSWDNQVNYLKNDTSFDPTTGIWNIGDLLSGEEVFLDIRVLISQTGTMIDTATATANNALDASHAFTINVPTPSGSNIDLRLTSTFANTNPTPGSTNTLTITARNAQTNRDATGVIINDGIPAYDADPSQITIISWRTRTRTGTGAWSAWTNNDSSYNPWTGVWNRGNLNRNVYAQLEITFIVPSTVGTTDVISTVYGNQNDPTLTNNYAKTSFNVAGTSMAAEESTSSAVESEQPLQTSKALFSSSAVETNSQPDTSFQSSLIDSDDGDQSHGILAEENTEPQDTGITGIITTLILTLLGTVSSVTTTILGALVGIFGH